MGAVTVPSEADAVFEGGGVKGIALVGGGAGAEAAGVREWKNVAGASAGAIVAALLAAGYKGKRNAQSPPKTPSLRDILGEVVYRDFPDYGAGGKVRGLPVLHAREVLGAQASNGCTAAWPTFRTSRTRRSPCPSGGTNSPSRCSKPPPRPGMPGTLRARRS